MTTGQGPAYLDTECGLEALQEHRDDPNWICNLAATCPAAGPNECGTAERYDRYKRTVCGNIDAARPSGSTINAWDSNWPCYVHAQAHRDALDAAGKVTRLYPEDIAKRLSLTNPIAAEADVWVEADEEREQDVYELDVFDPTFSLRPSAQPEWQRYGQTSSFSSCREYGYKASATDLPPNG